ncbi:MAG TPA: NAD(+) synthase [Patescibacteria group bacterium]|nr:NAD(+) synthase [Patescibacteria group bacterium]
MTNAPMLPYQFLDVRSHEYFRVAVLRPTVVIGDPEKNAAAHAALIKQVYEQGAMLAIGPEMGLVGYTIEDLNHHEMIEAASIRALGILRGQFLGIPIIVGVGMPLRVGTALYNCAVFFYQGKILAVYPKSYLPNYREFKDCRWFAPASALSSKEIILLGQKVPIGTDILIAPVEHPNVMIHAEVCEDSWLPIPPSSIAALHGATILCNLSASNDVATKADYRSKFLSVHSAKNYAVQLYASCGYGESTRDLVWGGDGYIIENGSILQQAKRFETEPGFLLADVRPSTLAMERQRQNTFTDNAVDFRREMRVVIVDGQLGVKSGEVYRDFHRSIEPHPFVPKNAATLNERCEDIFTMLTMSLVGRIHASGIQKLVLGLSGGLDSTLVAIVAAKAFDRLGLPRTNLTAVTMPGPGTTDRTRNNAAKLAQALGFAFETIPITEMTNLHLAQIGHDGKPGKGIYENAQARIRTLVLMDRAGELGAFVVGTGDLSEAAKGWCTFNGDHMSMYNPNAGVPKTLVKVLVAWAAHHVFESDAVAKGALIDIVDTPISPELLPPDVRGQILQKTEEVIGPYDLADFFLYYFVRFGFTPAHIAFLAYHAFKAPGANAYPLVEIKKWLADFITRFFANQWKRDTVPPGPKIGSVALSPRGDWRMSPETSAKPWLDDLARIPE